MGTTTTTYDVITRYTMRDDASRGTQALTGNVVGLERASASAGSMFGRLGAMVAGYVGFQQGNKHLVQYNSTMEQSRIQMAGLMAQAGSGDFTGNLDKASTLMRQMRDDSAKTVGTTQDYVSMASQLVQPLTMAKGTMEDIREMTRLSVVGTKAMGIDAVVGARDIDQAIRGMYRSVDQFTGKLLTPMGYGGEDGRKKFNAMSMQDRLRVLKASLKSKAVEDMAAAQENTFEGQFSTFQSIASQTMGAVGLPLFKGITGQLKEWNTWLQQNEKRVENIAGIVGNKLVQAAVSFKDAIGWAAQNWDKILVAWGALKAAGFLAAGSGGGALGAAGAASGGGFGAKAASISLVASAVYIGGTALADFIDRRQSEQINRTAGVNEGMMSLVSGSNNTTQASALRQMLFSQGLAGAGGLNKDAFASAVNADQFQRIKWAKTLGIANPHEATPEMIAEAMATSFARIMRDEMLNGSLSTDGIGGFYGAASNRTPLPKPEKAKINVTINRIEVSDQDPDRFVFRMVGAFRNAAKNPSGISSNLYALREG